MCQIVDRSFTTFSIDEKEEFFMELVR